MSDRLRNKVAVIVGGASGIGLATVKTFVREGCKVVIADVQDDKADAAAVELGNVAVAIRTDVTKERDVAAAVDLAVKRFGRLDCMVNDAGIVGAVGRVSMTSEQDWTASIAVLLTGVFFGMKHASRVMMEQGNGCILSLASTAGIVGGLGSHAYTATKHGVVGLTKSVAAELAPLGIRVNAVAPSVTVTPMVMNISGSQEGAVEISTRRSPMRQPLYPEDIAAGMLYLASDEARNVTGHILAIDAGLTTCGLRGEYDWTEPRFIGVAGLAPGN